MPKIHIFVKGKVYKDGDWWLAEVPALDILTQEKSKEEAVSMAADCVECYVPDNLDFKMKYMFSWFEEDNEFVLYPNEEDLNEDLMRLIDEKSEVAEKCERLNTIIVTIDAV